MPNRRRRRLLSTLAAVSTIVLTGTGLALAGDISSGRPGAVSTGRDCLAAVAQGSPHTLRQRVFESASATFGVPLSVLLGVSYLESRWDDHGASPSTSGGYGPMHLTDVDVAGVGDAKGDPSEVGAGGRGGQPVSMHTAQLAARLTGLPLSQLKAGGSANICGGAAVLAAYQHDLGRTPRARDSAVAWYQSVRRYSAAAAAGDSATFARRVFAQIKSGQARRTADGQRVRLAAQPGLTVPATPALDRGSRVDCPRDLNCDWVPAAYAWYGAPDPTAYGDHDLANRPKDLRINDIVIHDTEATWDDTLALIQDPTYAASWNYTVRSSDGHVTQHLDAKNVAWQAGNWWVNMHSIGVEHEGFAAQGATWYTEAMYENSADLVRYLAREYHVPLDRAHIIGHDQVPAPEASYVAGMHWDPGPYWDWEHYMRLLGAPITGRHHRHHHGATAASVAASAGHSAHGTGTYVVAPGFADNQQTVTGCVEAGVACDPQGSNFVYVHAEPSSTSPLVTDIGLHPDGSPSTTDVADIGARLSAGQRVVVTGRENGWASLWYLGQQGWVHSPRSQPVLHRVSARTVVSDAGQASVPVYGRAYPEQDAYPEQIPYQTVVPLQYSIPAGQAYVLADSSVPTDYYYAKTFDDSLPLDHTVVRGQDRYYEIWFGHRLALVRADDVHIR
jgi:N-acetyl-anhydromuramyl-L-alanine amidase AmpD